VLAPASGLAASKKPTPCQRLCKKVESCILSTKVGHARKDEAAFKCIGVSNIQQYNSLVERACGANKNTLFSFAVVCTGN